MHKTRPNIAFAGLTAAGKTTHAKILAQEIDYEYISATEILLEILNFPVEPTNAWLTNYDAIEKARKGDQVDIELEARLRKLATDRDGLILDT
jgi:cytidylate kinase